MSYFLSTATPRKDTILARQIAFAAAFLLPAAKLLEVPSLLAKHAAGDLLLPALLHFLTQTLLLLAVLYAASKSEKTLLERLKLRLGKGIFIVYALYALYFLFTAVLPLLDLEKFISAAFFDTAPTTFSFAVFFFFTAYLCTKGIKSIGRSADLCLFLFLFPFFALLVMALPAADFSALLPLFGEPFAHTKTAFSITTPHFFDCVLLLPLIANLRYQKHDGAKITIGYTVGSGFSLLFFAFFYGIFSSIAPREHYAFLKIAQYFPALSVVGRIDLLFIYLLTVVLLFYTCLPLQYTTDCLANLLHTERKTWISALLSLFLLIVILFTNRYYDGFYRIITQKLPVIFWIFGGIFPLLLLLLPVKPNEKKKDQPYA